MMVYPEPMMELYRALSVKEEKGAVLVINPQQEQIFVGLLQKYSAIG